MLVAVLPAEFAAPAAWFAPLLAPFAAEEAELVTSLAFTAGLGASPQAMNAPTIALSARKTKATFFMMMSLM